MFKNKILKYSVIAILFIVVVFSVIFIHHLLTTMSVGKCIDYCLENTNRNATHFSRIGDGRYIDDYAYFIAADGDSSKPQEIFVFKQKSLGFIDFDRYEFIMSSNYGSESNNGFGSIEFFTKKDNGEKEEGSTLFFFGANKDSDITEYEYTLTVREGSNVYRGRVVRTPNVWFVKFFDISSLDENTKKLVSNVKFYDSKGNLVNEY